MRLGYASVVAIATSLVPTVWFSPTTIECRMASASAAVQGGWRAYRANAARSGWIDGTLSEGLALRWEYRSPQPPRPAWPGSARMSFDRAYQPIIHQGKVFFGSSVDDAVYALAMKTGKVVWRFRTDAPVRFAPAAWHDRVFVASDDGFLYALAAADGRLLWKRRGGPNDQWVLGNGRVISKWPARGGPVVVGATVYFAAGIWPSDGIYLYALDPASGKVQWCNDDAGSMHMPQPHPTAEANSGIAAQGYLVVAGDHLLVPTGRAVPASFDRRTGRFEYFHLQKYGHQGNAWAMAAGGMFLNSGSAFDLGSGQRIARVGAGPWAATEKGLVRAGDGVLEVLVWKTIERPDRRGQKETGKALQSLWKVDALPDASALVVVGNRVVIGGPGKVAVADMQRRQIAWTSPVRGRVLGLAAAEGQLLVSTDTGSIACFAAGGMPRTIQTDRAPAPPAGADSSAFAQAAAEIVRRTGIRAGYCVDLGCGDGQLAIELAKRTDLQICAVDAKPEHVRTARARLADAGCYGTRVTVHQRPPAATGYPTYMADLVVSALTVTDGPHALPEREARRLQRPYGGAVCVGRPGKMRASFRGPLPGAGSWTHQYANAANTAVNDEARVKGRLTMLWFRGVDFELPSRHGRAPSPLCAEGRLFHEGIDGVLAVNAYNGRELWRYAIPGLLKAYDGDELMGVAGTGSNMCLHADRLFVRHGERCWRLDAATGAVLGQFTTPSDSEGNHKPWGYIACVDGILYGTWANPAHVVTYRFVNRGGDMSRLLTESRGLFALDAATGKLLWQYRAANSIRHNAIAIGNNTVCLIDRPLALFDRVKKPERKVHAPGKLVALNAKTGSKLWSVDDDIYGTVLAINSEAGVLLMSYQPTRFRLDSEFGGRMSAYDLDTGAQRWKITARYDSRPLIAGNTIYAQGGAWDLLSGAARPFHFGRSYGCGILAGCRNMLLFRSATLGYRALAAQGTTENYGGIRPGCWINALPAGGIVLVPDASAGCQCSYLNRAWIALEPTQR